jgi:hypothetical protein
MEFDMQRFFWMLLAFTFLSSCADLQDNPSSSHDAICKQLKHQMMFNGATSNQTLATQQRGEMGKLSQAYHNQGC